MIFHRVWDDVFSTWSHIAVLRVLLDSSQGLTGREIARLAGMTHRSCLKALTDLEALSMVRRQRGGRDHLFSLNQEHRLVRTGVLPLFAAERQFTKALYALLRRRLQKKTTSLIVFGSVARKEETSSSDLDLCLVVGTETEKRGVQDAVHHLAPEVLRQYGAKLSSLIVTKRQFVQKARQKQPPVYQILNDGIVIGGSTMRGLLHDKK